MATPLDSMETIRDEHTQVAADVGSRAFHEQLSTPDIIDIPIDIVNRMLYRTQNERSDRHADR